MAPKILYVLLKQFIKLVIEHRVAEEFVYFGILCITEQKRIFTFVMHT